MFSGLIDGSRAPLVSLKVVTAISASAVFSSEFTTAGDSVSSFFDSVVVSSFSVFSPDFVSARTLYFATFQTGSLEGEPTLPPIYHLG